MEVGDVILCTVERIQGTTVFVNIEGNKQATIVISEIAPGRIRNIRNYVVPKKQIVCKILRISQTGNIELSLRRVTKKEQKEVKEQYKQEKSYKSVLKSILKEKTNEVIKKITEQEKLFDFLQEAKQNLKKLEKIVGKENAEKILEILNAQKKKKTIIKKEFFLKTSKPNGIKLIKNILENISNAEIKYLSAGRYSIKKESENIKTSDDELKKILQEIKKKAKKSDMEFKIKDNRKP